VVDVEVRNFQSIERASFQIDGFTVVVGRSNIGKSALVRAVKAALTGASAASFVRHGPACLRRTKQAKTCKCHTSVHLRAEGFDLLWEKGDAINRYTFNGTVYDKAERGTPTFLNPEFGSVQVGTVGQLLQVADQFTPIFLLDQSGGTVADVLSDVARLDRINAAMRLSEKDRKDKVATRKVREKDVQGLEARLQSYAGLDDVIADVRGLDDKKVALEAREKAVQNIDEFMAGLSAFAGSIRDLTRASELVVPATTGLDQTIDRLDTLHDLTARLSEKAGAVQTLRGVEDIQVPSLQACQDTNKRLSTLSGWVDKAVELKGWIVPWKAVEDSPDLPLADLKAVYSQHGIVDGFVRDYEELTSAVTTLETSLAEVVDEVKKLDEEQRELGVCPTCIRPISECHGD